MPAKGAYLAIAGGGAILLWSGLRGKSWSTVIRNLVSGQSPGKAANVNPVNSSTPVTPAQSVLTETSPAGGSLTSQGGNPAGTDKTNQSLGKKLTAAVGWTGQEWTALNNIVMAESGWSDTVVNPGSGAAGIAQKITGWSVDYPQGNASAQILWMINYIRSRYGDPIAAWQFHMTNGYY
jgi:hypothetical protein